MTQVQNLLREIHRRSVWQVLGVYLAVSWVVIQVVETLTESAGLPDWVPPGALVLLLLGLPVVLATAIVQEGVGARSTSGAREALDEIPPDGPDDKEDQGSGQLAGPQAPEPANLATGTGSLDRPSTRPPTAHRLLTWRNAILGGVVAFALLGVAAAGYWTMWATGVGPVGSLVAQGVLEARDEVILADFDNLTTDAALGEVVTEALRVDLDRSEVLSPVSPAAVQRVLQRMDRADAEVLTAHLAREAAQREGIKAIIEGEVGSAGSGYVLTSRLVAASGDVLASFRVVARDGDEIIDAIDELSQDMRQRSGESLRTINSGEPLRDVTTGSMEALQLYTEAMSRSTRGDRAGAARLLEEAVTLDPDFAMAYRKLGVELGNLSMDPARRLEAVERAFELRSRLTVRERGLAEAYYYYGVAGDPARAAEAYERVLAQYPDEATALNNLAIIYGNTGRRDEAIALSQRAINGAGATATAHTNLLAGLWIMRRDDEAAELQLVIQERYPDTDLVAEMNVETALIRRRWADAHELAELRIRRYGSQSRARIESLKAMAAADATRGRLTEAREHSADALALALEEGQQEWVWDASSHRAWYELFAARAPGAATTLIENASAAHPYQGGFVNSWGLLNLAAFQALAGDPEGAAEIVGMAEAADARDQNWDNAFLYYQWAGALAADDAEAAAGHIGELKERLDCAATRCWGHFEEGLALEATGRADAAIAAYEEQFGGTRETEALWDGINFVASLEQLCHLSAEAGDEARKQEHCSAFVELWSDVDAELQPRVEAARERMSVQLPTTVGP